MDFQLRQATIHDADFLFALHSASMRDVIAATWEWNEAWQRDHFDSHFLPDTISLIYCEETPVGMLELRDRPDSLYVANLKVMPSWQSRGLGQSVMHEVLRRAAAEHRSVTLQVLEANVGARRLYERLGFVRIADTPPHIQFRHECPQ